jgi:nucleoside-diphosphate-sugar epimerase
MKIGVTGAEGFIGGHLIEYLHVRGYEIVTLGNQRRKLTSLQGVASYVGDIRDPQAVANAFEDCEVLVNLAAESSVMRCEEDPWYAYSTNVDGVRVLAEFASHRRTKFIQASSREVYGEQSRLPVPEETGYEAKNVYGRSKAEAEVALLESGIDCAIFRFANVIGTRDQGRLLPLWLTAASEGRSLNVFGGMQLIDFVPVETVVEAIEFALTHHIPFPVNIGSGQATPIMELAERIQAIVPGTIINVLPPREQEVKGYQADISFMVKLGIEPPADPLANLPELAQYYASVVSEVA